MNDPSDDKYLFEWNRYGKNCRSLLRSFRDEETFKDVTLACEEGEVSAHKVILAGISPVFKSILEKGSQPRPVIYFRGVKLAELEALMDFVYRGEAYVPQPNINSFLALAEDLKVKGLSEQEDSDGHVPEENNNTGELSGIKKPAVKGEPLDNEYQDLFNKIQNEDEDEESEDSPKESMEPDGNPNESKELSDHNDDTMKPDRSMLLAHITKEYVNGKLNYKCNICSKNDNNNTHILAHLERRHFQGMFTYNCKHCNKKYSSKATLTSHLFRKHRAINLEEEYHDLFNKTPKEEEESEDSPEEKKESEENLNMSKELSDDHDDDTRKPDRGMLFAQVSEVIVNGKLKFKCDLCLKSVKKKDNLISHLERHHYSGMFTYNCKHCNKQFNCMNALRSHLSYNHRN